MKRSRHQLAPAVPVQEVIDRAVAGRMPDRFLVGRLEIVDVQHLPGAGRFGKPREQGFFFGQRHVLVLASAIRLGFEGLDAAVLIDRVRTGHRAQRHAHCRRNRRLGHPTLTQQHHLDALALRRRYLPAQRSFQPPHLGFAAFDQLLSPNQMAQANHTSGEENSPRLSAKNPDSSRYGGSIMYAGLPPTRKSSRGGAKKSITSLSSRNHPSCSVPPGMTTTSPGPQTRCSLPRRNSILPLSIHTIICVSVRLNMDASPDAPPHEHSLITGENAAADLFADLLLR